MAKLIQMIQKQKYQQQNKAVLAHGWENPKAKKPREKYQNLLKLEIKKEGFNHGQNSIYASEFVL